MMRTASVVTFVFFCTQPLHAEAQGRFTQTDWTLSFDSHGIIESLTNSAGAGAVLISSTPGRLEMVSPSGERTTIPLKPERVTHLADGVEVIYGIDSDVPVTVAIRNAFVSIAGWPVLKRTVTVTPAAPPIDVSFDIVLNHHIQSATHEAFIPRQDGVGETVSEPAGTWVWAPTTNPADIIPDRRLAIPVIGEYLATNTACVTTIADAQASSAFTLSGAGTNRDLEVRAHMGALTLDRPMTRTVWNVMHNVDPEQAMQAWYATALADVPEGPDWLHDIAWQHYDYMSHGGQGWFEALDAIENFVALEDRGKIIFALHGWYDLLGRYSYDAGTKSLDDAWTAFPNAPNMKGKGFPTSEPVPMTKAELHRRIKYAKDRGVRVALYFADGLTACEGAGRFAEDRVLFWGGWNGPDTIGKAYCQDPTHPDVYAWYVEYLKALLAEYGNELDAFVWDETFMVRMGMTTSANAPRKAYVAPAMMQLTKELTQTTTAFRKELAFLTSDCIGGTVDEVNRWTDIPPYAIMAHGTYQDSHSRPSVWPYGIFPNYRNVLWSCNWNAVTRFAYTAFGTEHYDTPVATSNGWLDDKGIARLSEAERQAVLDLFAERKTQRQELQWLKGPAPAFTQ